MSLADFFQGPGRTVLGAGEYVESISFPLPRGRWGAGFFKLGWRKGMAISIVSAAAYIELAPDGSIQVARLALGSVAPTPVRCPNCEASLSGSRPCLEGFEAAGSAVQNDIAPIDDLRATASYRRYAAAVAVRRVLQRACEEAAGRTL